MWFAPRVRRSRRTRLREGPIVGRCDADRICLHPAPHYPERKSHRRALKERRVAADEEVGSEFRNEEPLRGQGRPQQSLETKAGESWRGVAMNWGRRRLATMTRLEVWHGISRGAARYIIGNQDSFRRRRRKSEPDSALPARRVRSPGQEGVATERRGYRCGVDIVAETRFMT